MTSPTRDDLALYAMGHYEGDTDAIEQLLAGDPDARAQLAAEADLELLLRDAASAATFCSVCHDLVRGDRCGACGVAPAPELARVATAVPAPERRRPARRVRAPAMVGAVTLAGAALVGAVVLGARSDSLVTEAPAVAPPLPAEPAPWVVELRMGTEPPAVAPPSPVKPATPKKPAPAVVELKIVTKPAGVAVVLDHQDLGLTPLVVKVPRRTASVELSLRHIGYQPFVRQLVLTSDNQFAVTLTSRGGPPVHQGKFADDQCMRCHKP